jgi:hypothetical protein
VTWQVTANAVQGRLGEFASALRQQGTEERR